MSLLEEGVSLEVIALLLGHESLATTHLYLEAGLAMKRKALEQTSPPKIKDTRFRPSDALLRFLEDL